MTTLNRKMHASLSMATKMLLIASLTILLTSCRSLTLMAKDKECIRMPESISYTPIVNGWFVPDAMMYDMLNALDRKK